MSKAILITAIAAMDEERAIGRNNDLPWKVPEDTRHFSKLTDGHTVLMGRKTFDSLPDRYKPLPNRMNIVVTRNPDQHSFDSDDVMYISDPIEYLKKAKNGELTLRSDEIWIVGGAEIYKLTMPLCDEVELTHIPGTHEGDTFFPEFEEVFEVANEKDIKVCRFVTYRRKSD